MSSACGKLRSVAKVRDIVSKRGQMLRIKTGRSNYAFDAVAAGGIGQGDPATPGEFVIYGPNGDQIISTGNQYVNTGDGSKRLGDNGQYGAVDISEVTDALRGPTPAVAVANNLVAWDGVTGRLVEDTGVSLSRLVPLGWGAMALDGPELGIGVIPAAWTEWIPTLRVAASANQYVVLAANGRLRIDYTGAPYSPDPSLGVRGQVTIMTSVDLNATNSDLLMATGVNGVVEPSADVLNVAWQTAGQHTAGLGLPGTYVFPFVGLQDQDEISAFFYSESLVDPTIFTFSMILTVQQAEHAFAL